MKRRLFPLLGMLLLCSCNHFTTEVPISSPENSEIDTDLLGKWILSTEKKEDRSLDYLEVSPFNEHEYLIQLIEYKDSSQLIKSFFNIRMFSSKLKDETYFNLQFIGLDNKDFMIYKVTPISSNQYKLYFLSTNRFDKEFRQSEKFKDYIDKHPHEFEEAFEEEGILFRKPD